VLADLPIKLNQRRVDRLAGTLACGLDKPDDGVEARIGRARRGGQRGGHAGSSSIRGRLLPDCLKSPRRRSVTDPMREVSVCWFMGDLSKIDSRSVG